MPESISCIADMPSSLLTNFVSDLCAEGVMAALITLYLRKRR